MHTEHAGGATTRRHMPDWVALILINAGSFAIVATLVLLSIAFDALVFDLR